MKHLRIRRRTAALLLTLILAGALASCQSAEPPANPSGENPAAAVTTEAETEAVTTAYLDSLPAEDLDGYTFRVEGQSTLQRQNFYTQDKEGEIINDAVHTRDLTVEERLNVKLEYTALESRDEAASLIVKTVLADDAAYEMVITALSAGINTMVAANVLYDLNTIPVLSVDGETGLWNRSIHDQMQFYNKQYFTTGVISPQFIQSPVTCEFNKKLVDSYQLGDIYQIVQDGGWTLEFMDDCITATSNDLDGNGTMDINDFYGFSLDGVFGNVLFSTAGCNPIRIEGGEYVIDLADPSIVTLIDKCAGIFGDPARVYQNKKSDGSSHVVFMAGRSVFTTADMLDVQKFRDMEDDFGIIPTPKIDESQDGYFTSCTTWLPTGVAVPKNCQNIDRFGLIMETMAAISESVIKPAVYEVTLQGKVARDDMSVLMLDIIYQNPTYDFITAFDIGSSGTELRQAVLGWKENWTSTWAGIEKKVNIAINDIMENAKE